MYTKRAREYADVIRRTDGLHCKRPNNNIFARYFWRQLKLCKRIIYVKNITVHKYLLIYGDTTNVQVQQIFIYNNTLWLCFLL